MPAAKYKVQLILFFLLLLLALVSGLDKIALRAEEPRRALSAAETALNAEGIPLITGAPYYNKPPLYIHLQGAVLKFSGSSSEWAVRLPGILSFMLLGLVLFLFVSRFISREIAILSSLIFYTSGDLLFYGTVYSGEMDLFFALLVCVQVFGVYAYIQKHAWWKAYLILYLLTFLGLMTKGFPSAVFHVSLLGLMAWQQRGLKVLFHPSHLLGFILLMGGLLGGYQLYDQRGDAAVYALSLLSESAEKSAGAYGFTRIMGHFIEFPFQLLALMLPWSLLLLGFRKSHLQNLPEALRFLLLFVLINLSVYWISPGTRNRYLYMFLPILSIWLAKISTQVTYQQVAKWLTNLMAIVLCAAGLAVFIPGIFEHIPFYAGLLCLSFSVGIWWMQSGRNTWKIEPILTLGISLVLMRIAFNYTFLPEADARSESRRYAQHTAEILKITGNAPVFLFGPQNCVPLNLSYLSRGIDPIQKCTPPLLPYQIPWTYHQKSGRFIVHAREVVESNFYLCHVSALPENMEILYRFQDEWNRQEMVLFRNSGTGR